MTNVQVKVSISYENLSASSSKERLHRPFAHFMSHDFFEKAIVTYFETFIIH